MFYQTLSSVNSTDPIVPFPPSPLRKYDMRCAGYLAGSHVGTTSSPLLTTRLARRIDALLCRSRSLTYFGIPVEWKSYMCTQEAQDPFVGPLGKSVDFLTRPTSSFDLKSPPLAIFFQLYTSPSPLVNLQIPQNSDLSDTITMGGPDRPQMNVSKALEIAKSNPDVPAEVTTKLEQKNADVWQKVQSKPNTYILDREEYAVLNYYQERYKNNSRYDEAIKRFWKHFNGGASSTNGASSSQSSSKK